MEESIKICVTCLSADRRLVPVITLTALLQEIHIELKESSGEVCWECWSILVKFDRFKKKAKIAHETLSQITEHFNIKSLTTLSKTKIFYDYNYLYNFDYETNLDYRIVSIKQENPDQSDQMVDHFNLLDETLVINEDPIIKPEKNDYFYSEADIIENKHKINVLVKQENIFEDERVISNETHNSSGDAEESGLSRTAKSEKKNVNTVKKRSQIAVKDMADKDFEEKFVQLVLTEEEMLAHRKEKRHNPAFKALPFICDGCLLGFRKEDKYRFHMKQKHDKGIGNLMCNICSIRFPHNLALSEHKIKHYVVYRCKLCRYQGNNLGSAVSHCKNKHATDKPDSIHCSQCRFMAKNSQDLQRHMVSNHRFSCHECGEEFTLKKNLRTHLTSHDKEESSQGSQNVIETGYHQDLLNTRHTINVIVNNKKESQKRYREQNRDKLKQREAERRKRIKYSRSIAGPSTSSNTNIIELNNEEIITPITQSSSGLEKTQPSSNQRNEQDKEMNALQRKREYQQRYREQNRDKLKQREVERRRRLQNAEMITELSTSPNIKFTEIINEPVIDEISTNSRSAAGSGEMQHVVVEISQQNGRGQSSANVIVRGLVSKISI